MVQLEKRTPIIYILAGKARSGKDSSVIFLKEYYENLGKKVLQLEFKHYLVEYTKAMTDWDGDLDNKPREVLNYIGTDIIRNQIDEAFFIKRTLEDILVYSYYFDVIIISDSRFPLEIESVKNAYPNALSLHLIREVEGSLNERELTHAVETSLNGYQNYDYTVFNEGTLEDLREKIMNIAKEVEQDEH